MADRRVVRGNQSLRFLSAAGLPEPRPSAVSEPAFVCVCERGMAGGFSEAEKLLKVSDEPTA